MTHDPLTHCLVFSVPQCVEDHTKEGRGDGGRNGKGWDEKRGRWRKREGKGKTPHPLQSYFNHFCTFILFWSTKWLVTHATWFLPAVDFTYACAFQTHKTPCRTHNIWMVSLMRILMCLLKCPEWLHVNSATPCVKRLQQTLTVYSTFKRFHIQFHCHNVYLASYTEES